jgi:hypothetical protein
MHCLCRRLRVHFLSNGPEGPVARVFVRNGRLMMLLSEDEDAAAVRLEPLRPGLFRIGEVEYSPELCSLRYRHPRPSVTALCVRGAALSQGFSMIVLRLRQQLHGSFSQLRAQPVQHTTLLA